MKNNTEGLQEGNEVDEVYVPPKIKKEELAEVFLTWAEKYWGLDKLYAENDVNSELNQESAPWSYIRNLFKNKTNELLDNVEDHDKPSDSERLFVVKYEAMLSTLTQLKKLGVGDNDEDHIYINNWVTENEPEYLDIITRNKKERQNMLTFAQVLMNDLLSYEDSNGMRQIKSESLSRIQKVLDKWRI